MQVFKVFLTTKRMVNISLSFFLRLKDAIITDGKKYAVVLEAAKTSLGEKTFFKMLCLGEQKNF